MSNALQVEFLNSGLGTAYGLGYVYAYEAGTTTAKTVYTAADKSASAAQPFQLDANGRATVYADGNYKLVIKDANLANTITLDNQYYEIPPTSSRAVTSVSADYTATTSDYMILVNTASDAVTINLPTAIGNEGLEFVIVKTSADANAVTVDPYGTQSISGSTTRTIPTQHETLGVISNNSNWTMTSSPGAVTLTGTQTLTNKTLTSPSMTGPVMSVPQIQDTSSDHQYIFAVNELTADRTVTLPLLTGNDTFTFNAFAATLTNKTLTAPTIADLTNMNHTHTSAASGGFVGVVQYEHAAVSAIVSGSTVMPLDDTIPQITEGFEIITCEITPLSATNILIIIANIGSITAAGSSLSMALFQDATANALAAVSMVSGIGGTSLTYKMAAGTTSATTFRVRFGSSGAGTNYINTVPTTSGRAFGGVASTTLTIIEVVP